MGWPCILSGVKMACIYKDNFYDIWETKYELFRDRSWTKIGKCTDCTNYNDCQGNGFHYWQGEKKNVLVCHNEKLNGAKCLI